MICVVLLRNSMHRNVCLHKDNSYIKESPISKTHGVILGSYSLFSALTPNISSEYNDMKKKETCETLSVVGRTTGQKYCTTCCLLI